jgi:hypothetical protein
MTTSGSPKTQCRWTTRPSVTAELLRASTSSNAGINCNTITCPRRRHEPPARQFVEPEAMSAAEHVSPLTPSHHQDPASGAATSAVRSAGDRGRMACEKRTKLTNQEFIQNAGKTLGRQAAITLEGTSNRICLYARFGDLRPIDVCQAILDDTVRRLTMQENEKLAVGPGDSDAQTRTGYDTVSADVP